MYVDQVLVLWLKVLTAVAAQWLKQWFTMFLKKNVIWYPKKIANSSRNKFHSKYIPFFLRKSNQKIESATAPASTLLREENKEHTNYLEDPKQIFISACCRLRIFSWSKHNIKDIE